MVAFAVQMAAMTFLVSLGFSNGSIPAECSAAELEEKLEELINRYSLHITALTNIVLIPCFALLLGADEKKRRLAAGFSYKLPGIKSFALIGILGMAAAVSVNVLVSISGLAYFSPKYQQVSQIIYSGGIFMEIVSAVIAAPVLEELLFRGMIYKRLRDFCSAKAAMLISAAFFGLFHGNLVQLVYAFIIGLMLAYVYERFKTIWAPIVFHFGANLLSVLITELMPQSFTSMVVILVVMVVCTALTVVLLKYVYGYSAGIRTAKEDEEVLRGDKYE